MSTSAASVMALAACCASEAFRSTNCGSLSGTRCFTATSMPSRYALYIITCTSAHLSAYVVRLYICLLYLILGYALLMSDGAGRQAASLHICCDNQQRLQQPRHVGFQHLKLEFSASLFFFLMCGIGDAVESMLQGAARTLSGTCCLNSWTGVLRLTLFFWPATMGFFFRPMK